MGATYREWEGRRQQYPDKFRGNMNLRYILQRTQA